MSARHMTAKCVRAVISGPTASAHLCIRTCAGQNIPIFSNLHPKSLHAGMHSVTRESEGQLPVKLLRTDSFRNSYRSVYPAEVEKFCSLRMGPLPLFYQDPPNQGHSIFSVLVPRNVYQLLSP